MTIEQVTSRCRKAISDYGMIADGDRVAIGMSGGKDSLTLLDAMAGLRRYYPQHFDLVAVTVDLGFGDTDYDAIKSRCEQEQVEYILVHTDIGRVIFTDRKEKNPCSLCSKMRKGALNDAAIAAGCNKIAYAHHKDDVIETMILSLLFEGRFYSFAPVTYLDRTGLTVIRPLIYLYECEIIGYMNKASLPVMKSPCPADGHTKRQYAHEFVRELNIEYPGIKEKLFHAVMSGLPEWRQEHGR